MSAAPHVPVLIDEVLDALAIAPGEVHEVGPHRGLVVDFFYEDRFF